MSYQVKQGSTVLEDRWYGYNRGGQPKRIVSNYPDSANPGLYYVKLLQYTTGQQVWLYREFTATKGAGGVPENITPVVGYQFRYDGQDARARYLVREIDPSDLTEVPVSGATSWHEYVGGRIFHDLATNAQGGFDVDRSYVHGLGLVRMTDFSLAGDPVDYFHGDMLGTSRVLTDATGAVDHRLRFSAFGEPLPLATLGSPPAGPPTQSTRYGYAGSFGYQHDGLANTTRELGALHVGARFYDPEVGRFWQRDPIGLMGGLNGYSYASNTPSLLIDPSGTLGIVTVAAAVTAVVVLAIVATYANNLAMTPKRVLPTNGLTAPLGPNTTAGGPLNWQNVIDSTAGILRNCPGLTTTGPSTLPLGPDDAFPNIIIPLLPD